MTIDLKSILTEQFTRMFENHLGLIAIVFAVAIVAFTFRHTIAYNLDLNKRERNKFSKKNITYPYSYNNGNGRVSLHKTRLFSPFYHNIFHFDIFFIFAWDIGYDC